MKRYNTKTLLAVESAMRIAQRPLSVKELINATGVTRITINSMLQRLISEGRVREVRGLGIPPCYALSDAACGPLLYQAGECLYWTAPEGFRASYTVEITVGEVAKEGEVRHE